MIDDPSRLSPSFGWLLGLNCMCGHGETPVLSSGFGVCDFRNWDFGGRISVHLSVDVKPGPLIRNQSRVRNHPEHMI